MECRPGCAACCIAISINSKLPGYRKGKKAGVRCSNLDNETLLCKIWGTQEYPPVCREFRAGIEHCGKNNKEAMVLLQKLEIETLP